MTDSFSPVARVPAAVPFVETVRKVTKGTPNTYEARYSFDVQDATGEHVDTRSGNLLPWVQGWTLTAGQKTALAACVKVADVEKLLLDFYLTKAQGAIG